MASAASVRQRFCCSVCEESFDAAWDLAVHIVRAHDGHDLASDLVDRHQRVAILAVKAMLRAADQKWQPQDRR